MSNIQPELTFKAVVLTGASLETVPEVYSTQGNMVYRINIAPEISQENTPGNFRVMLRATAEGFIAKDVKDIKEGDKPLAVAEVTVTGFVGLRGVNAQQLEYALKVEVPNQLVPVVRMHLQQLALQANLRPVVLPFITFQVNTDMTAFDAPAANQLH